jgi:hypothetical protein
MNEGAAMSGRALRAPGLPAGRLAAGAALVWAGASIGVGLAGAAGGWPAPGQWGAPVETPRLYGLAQAAGLALLALLALRAPGRRRWLAWLCPPALAVAAQALWASSLPLAAAAVLEAGKVAWLLAVGFGAHLTAGSSPGGRARRSSWIPIAPGRPLPERAWPISARR